MSLFPCQGRIVCRNCFGSPWGPEGSPGRVRTLTWLCKESWRTGHVSRQSLGCLCPHTHSSSITVSQRSPPQSQRSLSFFLASPCFSHCMLYKCCPLSPSLPFSFSLNPLWPLQDVSWMSDGPAPSPGPVSPNTNNKLILHSFLWEYRRKNRGGNKYFEG